jgi:hypothetical protein
MVSVQGDVAIAKTLTVKDCTVNSTASMTATGKWRYFFLFFSINSSALKPVTNTASMTATGM